MDRAYIIWCSESIVLYIDLLNVAYLGKHRRRNAGTQMAVPTCENEAARVMGLGQISMPTGDAYSSGFLVPSLWDLYMHGTPNLQKFKYLESSLLKKRALY